MDTTNTDQLLTHRSPLPGEHRVLLDTNEIASITADGHITCHNQRWRIVREGNGQASKVIQILLDNASVAQFAPRWTGHRTLSFADGRRYTWRYIPARGVAEWRDHDGHLAMDFNRRATQEWRVRCFAAYAAEPHKYLLFVFAYYLLLEEETVFARGLLAGVRR